MKINALKKAGLIPLACVLILSISGCATLWKGSSCSKLGDSYHYRDYVIQIVSKPRGAKIEWNRKVMGEAPVRVKYNGIFFYDTTIVVRAYPAGEGQYVQTKVLSGRKPLPRKIYFDMNLKEPQGHDKVK